MPRRDRFSHVNKTQNERSAYQRYIQQLDSQPTIHESDDLDLSFEPRPELAESTSEKKRPVPVGFRLQQHFEQNWVGWLVTALLFIALYIINESRVATKLLTDDLSDLDRKVEVMNTSIENNNSADHAQDLLIQEIKIRFEDFINDIADSQAPSSPINTTPTPNISITGTPTPGSP